MYGDRRPEFDPDRALDNLKETWRRVNDKLPGGGGTGILIGGIVALILLIWLATGFYIVGPGEQAAVRLFGQFRGFEDAGLKWYFPTPIGSRTIVNIEEVRQMSVGFRTEPERRPEMAESQMITGDLNIVNIELVVQYRVADVEDFLFRVADPGDPDRDIPPGQPDGRTLRDATEAALRQVVGQRGIDDVLTQERAAVEADTLSLLQQLMEEYQTGIGVLAVQLQEINPPAPVRQAFDDVVSARLNLESRVNQALAYEQDRIPRAQGAAQQVVQAAQAFTDARVAEARGQADQFNLIYQEYQGSPEVSRQRLYLEAMQRLLPGVTIYLLDESGNALPLLPLGPTGALTPPAPPAPVPTTPSPTPTPTPTPTAGGG